MLKGILEGEECVKCRVCCEFDNDDYWEMPHITDEVAEKIAAMGIETSYLKYKDKRIFDYPDIPLWKCPLVGEGGCVLGNEKPFECSIWPYRVMKLGEYLVVTISPVCENLYSRPLNLLKSHLDTILPKIKDYAKGHPNSVLDYIDGYPILEVLR